LESRTHVFDRILENSRRVVARAFAQDVHGVVHNVLGGGFLAVEHHAVDDLGDQTAAIDGVWLDLPLGCLRSSGHAVRLPVLTAELDAVLRAALLTIGHSGCVERRADYLIPDAG